MFRYTENDLYDRCGAMEVIHDRKKPAEFTGKFVEIGGEKIPVIRHQPYYGVNFTRYLCLRTYLGYIPVESIECFRDIFNRENYLHDELEWIKPYDAKVASDYEKNKVKQLSKALGKHWK